MRAAAVPSRVPSDSETSALLALYTPADELKRRSTRSERPLPSRSATTTSLYWLVSPTELIWCLAGNVKPPVASPSASWTSAKPAGATPQQAYVLLRRTKMRSARPSPLTSPVRVSSYQPISALLVEVEVRAAVEKLPLAWPSATISVRLPVEVVPLVVVRRRIATASARPSPLMSAMRETSSVTPAVRVMTADHELLSVVTSEL